MNDFINKISVQNDSEMPYPRVCAHRGYPELAPENSMPSYGIAVAMGAEEIEFDLWASKDGVLVTTHDSTLDRTSNGHGRIWDYTLEELKKLDFGVEQGEYGEYGDKFKGLRIATFEEILKQFARRVIMNIHVKLWDNHLTGENEFLQYDYMEEIIAMIRKYNAEKHVYFMSTGDEKLKKAKRLAPDIHVCVGNDRNRPYEIVNRAIEIGAEKVQLFVPYFDQEMIDKAHEHGIICNVFCCDRLCDAQRFLDMKIDCLLTNRYNMIAQFTKEYLSKKQFK